MPIPQNPYQKPVLSTPALISHLRAKGLVINDEQQANAVIQQVGYYRFRGYALAFRNLRTPDRCFYPDTTFENVLSLAEFDRRLRILTLEHIFCVELYFRTNFSEYMVSAYEDPFWFLDGQRFKDQDSHKMFLNNAETNVARAKDNEKFIKHYYEKYNSPTFPPSWMLTEVNTFGDWSRAFANLQHSSDKREIAKRITTESWQVLKSWIHHLTYIRNICAHQSRLCNKVARIRPQIPRTIGNIPGATAGDRFSSTAFVLVELLRPLNKDEEWKLSLRRLLSTLPQRMLFQMGFQSDWTLDRYWN